jgi:hypothetical protein
MNKTIHLSSPKTEEAVTNNKSGLPVGGKNRPALKFVYVHYPHAWSYEEGFGFLPLLSKIIAKAGVNGVSSKGSLTMTLAAVGQKGGTFIDPKDTRLGDHMNYVEYYDTQNGGKWYVDKGVKATILSTGAIYWNTKDMKDTFMEFRKGIRDSGIIAPPLQEIYVSLVERQRAAIDQLYARLDRNPHLKTKVDKAEADLAGMEKAWAKLTKKATTKTTPTSKVADLQL